MSQLVRNLATICGAILLALAVESCSSCRGERVVDTPSAAPETNLHPSTPEAVSRAFAQRLPDGTPMLLIARDWRDIFNAYDEIRALLDAISGDLGVVETDLRNTLGIDLMRVETLSSLGIAPDGGGAVSAIDSTTFIMLVLDDSRLFEERVTQILRLRPFDLDGPVERVTIRDAVTLRFRHSEAADPEAVIAIDGPFAYIFPDGSAPGIDQIIDGLVTPGDGSLAERPGFDASIAGAEGYQLHGWFSARALADDQGAELRDRIERQLGDAADASNMLLQIRNMGDITVGLDISASGLRTRLRQHPSERVLDEFRATTAATTTPGFDQLVNADVYAMLRLTVSSQHLYRLFEEFAPAEMRARVAAEIGRHQELLGMDPVAELLPAHGPNLVILLTRARLLTLSRAVNSGAPGELFNGLGVVIALEVTNPAKIHRALAALVPQLDGRAELYEANGNTIVEFTDASADIGNLVLTDRYLVLVPGRQRDELLAQVQAGEGATLEAIDVDAARELVTAPSANGLFIDMQRVVDGPIGQVALARLPNEVRRMLGQFTRVTITVGSTDDEIIGDLAIRFAPTRTTP